MLLIRSRYSFLTKNFDPFFYTCCEKSFTPSFSPTPPSAYAFGVFIYTGALCTDFEYSEKAIILRMRAERKRTRPGLNSIRMYMQLWRVRMTGGGVFVWQALDLGVYMANGIDCWDKIWIAIFIYAK